MNALVREAHGGPPAGSAPVAAVAGATALEMLVVLLLAAALVQATWSVVAGQRRAAEALFVRAEGLADERILRSVLRAEAAAGRKGADWRVTSGDVLSIRAFRAWGVPCPSPAENGDLLVRVAGMRRPDSGKDSLLVLGRDGRWSVHGLESTAATDERCAAAPDTPVRRWRVPAPARTGVLFRVFEPGSYHLEDPTLRYRRGRAGRQPLTGAVFDPAATGFEPLADGRVRLRVGRIPESGRVGRGRGQPSDPWSRLLPSNGGGS